MNIEVPPGRYVVAVSGGVDSMSLLHRLTATAGVEIVVAHFDHGIRNDSADDRKLVQAFVADRQLPFVFKNGSLGAGASEATARRARYDFLHETRQAYHAKAVLTAHHQGDLLETAIINMLRGTNRRGLSSLGDSQYVLRPMLHISKPDIIAYAQAHDIPWREDSTNTDERYLRNYIRHQLLPRFDAAQQQQLVDLVSAMRRLNGDIDRQLVNVLHMQTAAARIDRSWFVGLPHAVAREVLAAWLREHRVADFEKKTLERLVVAAKTARTGTRHDAVKGWSMHVGKDHLALRELER